MSGIIRKSRPATFLRETNLALLFFLILVTYLSHIQQTRSIVDQSRVHRGIRDLGRSTNHGMYISFHTFINMRKISLTYAGSWIGLEFQPGSW